MSQQRILELIAKHAREVVPGLEGHVFAPGDSLRELGANSIDRVDIIVMTLEALSLDVPLAAMANARNIGELAGIIDANA
ncbi:acyl carrier protein [Burkholderia oklahomensis]|uniref:acyl carrier protein n=1 Tax=Burkholderia oklahomensis TaxID=342113 RepID=UPI00264FDD46|nr:acyl carrier protein [Burkholderia oklahomensis]MDN7675146.1 acyl carrier protein [Burkholderia oklahomensis]